MTNPLVKVLEQALRDKVLVGKHPPGDAQRLARLEKDHGVRFPADFRDVMLWSDGFGTGFRKTQVNVLPMKRLGVLNRQDDAETYLPRMFVIGSDGGGALYFYDPTNALGRGAYAIFLVPQGEIGFDDAMFAGPSLTDVVRSVLNNESFFDRPRLKDEGTKIAKGARKPSDRSRRS
jgi:hypothetical protein